MGPQEEEAEHRLRIKIESERAEDHGRESCCLSRNHSKRDVEQFALRLANDPDEISAVTEIIREDQLTKRQDTIDFIKHMVDSGVVERWEVSDQVREALEWLREPPRA